MCGASLSVVAISCPQVRSVAPVAINPSENRASGKDDGLKTWTRRPSRSRRQSSLTTSPTAISRNCRRNQSARNQRNRLMLKKTGTVPRPSVQASRRVQDSRRSNAPGKQQLRRQQMRRVVHLAPVPGCSAAAAASPRRPGGDDAGGHAPAAARSRPRGPAAGKGSASGGWPPFPTVTRWSNQRRRSVGSRPSSGAPVPDEPMNSVRPSGRVRSRPLARRVPSFDA